MSDVISNLRGLLFMASMVEPDSRPVKAITSAAWLRTRRRNRGGGGLGGCDGRAVCGLLAHAHNTLGSGIDVSSLCALGG